MNNRGGGHRISWNAIKVRLRFPEVRKEILPVDESCSCLLVGSSQNIIFRCELPALWIWDLLSQPIL